MVRRNGLEEGQLKSDELIFNHYFFLQFNLRYLTTGSTRSSGMVPGTLTWQIEYFFHTEIALIY